MTKIDKKRKKLQERIDFLQEQMKSELGKKTHNTSEINLPDTLRKINDLRVELSNLK